MESISVIGLGKLGAPIAACFASKGFRVIGFDVMPAAVAAMAAHKAPVTETGLEELVAANAERISATSDWSEVIGGSGTSFIVVPTPSGPDGAFSSKFVVDAVEHIGATLKNKSSFHLVVVVSTVMPGASDHEIIPALERASGKIAGKDFGYCYSPTLIALGSVIRDFLNPDLVMIGESDARSGEMLEAIYTSVFDSKPIFHHVKPAEAELAKIAINTFVTTKISFANMLGTIAEKMGGVDVDRVTKILGSDGRIGSKYLKAGGSYGGPCFPRDNRALTRAAELVGAETYIPQATDRTNREYIEELARRVDAAHPAKVAIIGVSYKPNTEVVEEAMGLHLAQTLAAKKIPVLIYDPLALASARKTLGDSVEYADSLEASLAAAKFIVITNPYKEMFAKIDRTVLKDKTIIDCWNILG